MLWRKNYKEILCKYMFSLFYEYCHILLPYIANSALAHVHCTNKNIKIGTSHVLKGLIFPRRLCYATCLDLNIGRGLYSHAQILSTCIRLFVGYTVTTIYTQLYIKNSRRHGRRRRNRRRRRPLLDSLNISCSSGAQHCPSWTF